MLFDQLVGRILLRSRGKAARRDWATYTCSSRPTCADRPEGGPEKRLRISRHHATRRDPRFAAACAISFGARPVFRSIETLARLPQASTDNFQNLVGVVFVGQLDRRTFRQERRQARHRKSRAACTRPATCFRLPRRGRRRAACSRLAVPNEFFAHAPASRVILRIIGKTYSSRCTSSHSTTPRVWEVMLVTWIRPPSREENCWRVSVGSICSPETFSSSSKDKNRLDRRRRPRPLRPGFTSSITGGFGQAARSSRAPSACASCRRRAESCRSRPKSCFASCITISQIVLHFSTRCWLRLLEFFAGQLDLDALAVVTVDDRAAACGWRAGSWRPSARLCRSW